MFVLRVLACLAVCTGLSADPAVATVYSWQDESGARHFTNSEEEVPEDRRDTARSFRTRRQPGTVTTIPREPPSARPAAAVAARRREGRA